MSAREIIVERIISLLEKGTVPWRQTWELGLPQNLVSKKLYRGVNVFLLQAAMGKFSSPFFVTFKQALNLGGKVKAGEHGWPVVFWKPVVISESNDESINDITRKDTTRFVLRYYYVFNANQCEGLELEDKKNKNKNKTTEKDVKVENIFKGYLENGPKIENGLKPRYLAIYDIVQIPPKRNFETKDAYYNALFHELIHSTGHVNRLNRPGLMDPHFGSELYSKEELVAEMGATILCAHTGIKADIENSAAYIQSWLPILKNDRNMVIVAASHAQKAVDLIIGNQQET